jgi:hypothetical protein
MYTTSDIQRAGWVNVMGGMASFFIGVAAQIIVGFEIQRALVGNVFMYVLIGGGWFFAAVLINASLYQRLITEEGRRKIIRLEHRPAAAETAPPKKFGLTWLQVEVGAMVVWALSLLFFQFVMGQVLILPVGGFVGGYLAAQGIARVRFSAKVRQEEAEERRIFYFSDLALSTRTETAYFTERTDDLHPYGLPKNPDTATVSTSTTAAPPGVKKRAGVTAKKED